MMGGERENFEKIGENLEDGGKREKAWRFIHGGGWEEGEKTEEREKKKLTALGYR